MDTTTAGERYDGQGPEEGGGADGPVRWSRLASFGFLMAATGALLMIAASVIWGLDTEDLAFFVIPLVLGVVGAVLVRQRRTWMRVVALVLALAVAMALFWTMFGLAAPASFFDFVPGLLVVPGVLIALVAGIASLRAGRHDATRTASPRERTAMVAIGGVLGALAVVSAVLSVAGRETVSDSEAAEADFVVDLKDFEFDQATYETSGDVTVLVKNSDPFLHTFTVDELGIDVELNAGSEKLVTIPAEAGTYVLYCEPHTSDPEDPGEDDMAATLTVG
jgi:plastocyanin